MNEDFNYRPRPNSGPTPNQQPQQPAAPVNQPPSQPDVESAELESAGVTNPSPVITSGRRGPDFKGALKFLSVVLLLALAAAAAYFWQQQKVDKLSSANASLDSQVRSLKAQSTKESVAEEKTATPTPAPTTTTYTLITGSASRITETGADLAAYYQGTNLTEVWIEYGIQAENLKTSTQKVKTTGEGDAGTYVEQAFAVTGLQAGTQYFYRTAATTTDGKTIYGGVAALRTTK